MTTSSYIANHNKQARAAGTRMEWSYEGHIIVANSAHEAYQVLVAAKGEGR